MSTGATHNMAGIVVVRCILGVFEASFGAGAPYYLSLFYQRKELALRVSLLLGMSPLANCFAGALAYGITHIKHGLEPWRWLFIIGMCKIPAHYRQVFEEPKLTTKTHRGGANRTLFPCRLFLSSRWSRTGQVSLRERANTGRRAHANQRPHREEQSAMDPILLRSPRLSQRGPHADPFHVQLLLRWTVQLSTNHHQGDGIFQHQCSRLDCSGVLCKLLALYCSGICQRPLWKERFHCCWIRRHGLYWVPPVGDD